MRGETTTTNTLADLARLHYQNIPRLYRGKPTALWLVRLADEVERLQAENERLRTLLDSLMQELEITDAATPWKQITSYVKPEHAEALEQYFREWEARDE